MLRKIAAFEARYQLRSPLFVLSFLIFFLLTFGAVTSPNIQIGGPRGSTHLNAPYALLQTMATMHVMAIFIVTAFVANVVLRDEESGFAPLLRATRIRKFDYLLGRFIGAMAVAFLVTLAVPLAFAIGSLMPWQDAEQIGPLVLSHYLYASLVMGLPTLLVLGAGFFALATVTRSMMWSYVGTVAFLVLFGASRALLRDPAFNTLAALSDPFGIGALGQATKYWTTVERNSLLPPLQGLLLQNRLIWLAAAAALFALAYRLFSFEPKRTRSHPKKAKTTNEPPPQLKPLAAPKRGRGTGLAQFLALARFDMAFVFRSPAFFVLLAIGLFNALASLLISATERGVSYFPVTRSVVTVLEGGFSFILVLIAVYYAGELVWRDRERRMHEIVDASAAPNWAFLAPKVLAISGVLLGCYLVASAAGMALQLAKGYFDLQPLGYLLWLVLPGLIAALLLAILSVFVQALSPHKYVGWALMLVFTVATMVMATLGFEDKLYTFGEAPAVPLSDMNAMGRFWIGRAWLQAYWLAFGAVLLALTHLLWRRGAETRLRPRLQALRHRLRGRAGLLLGASSLAWLGCGAWVFYNTHVLNEYEPAPAAEQRQADYEKTLLPYAELPQPTIAELELQVDLFPRQTRAETQGSYVLENRSGQPISQVHIAWMRGLQMQALELDGARLEQDLKRFDYRIYRLATPMQPGERRSLRFRTLLEEKGFVNDRPLTQIVANGSFVNHAMLTPGLGVQRRYFLDDRAKRRKYGLPPEQRVAKLEDESARAHNYLRRDSDWVSAHITLTTDADQTPVAPGRIISDRISGSGPGARRTLETRSEAPVANFFSLQSARYQIQQENWVSPQGKPVALQVFYHPPHAHNVGRMLAAMKASLEVYSRAFGPYQFSHARILEFPAYERFAQAFSGTMPYSEAIGFIQDFKDEDSEEKVDLVTMVTAHEIAHQWWAHQINGANKQGMTLLSETFAQYSALLVMEKLYGRAQIRKFLKYELDSYLRSRASELVEELPLARVENQPYIHYRKGAVAMYALKEAVGEDVVNRALRKLLAEFAFKPAPYADSRDFLRLLRAEAGPQHEQLIADLFERITLYDIKASQAWAQKRADGRFEVGFTVEAKKFYADGKGHETEVPLQSEALDIGAFSAEPGKKGFSQAAVLRMERQALKTGRQEIRLLLDRAPAFVGADPYNLVLDRNSDDNLVKVELR
ncbi:aminopeptidase N/ABC-type transport system involved in multi-copper enzyme maturation permease subunit [Paucibacter oligotrophus]|uniref:Aminopeptidase N/ABC-type transport system involved in multi-copper enzyme maturation permease subunit n=1 Tax=Roseateles oligotrophus TaxID=1769250 RepID=A0A840LGX6_9BURK|nr:M1 family aminopeptidase [Roseateles oligotrophus]MBB4844527.1 aminopeptidase N/ABC-type transport system involved in multi-copper enzyme maturation permease subunit [Roseateles oligotrophus]